MKLTAWFPVNRDAVAAWLKQGERQARGVATRPYSAATFREALKGIRSLTRLSAAEFPSELVEQCAQSVVVVPFVPEITGSRVCGATRWLTPNRAVIQLSLRYKTDDHLWFSFFHEAGHILLHPKKAVFLEGLQPEDAQEDQVDRFARDALIAPEDYRRFTAEAYFSKDAVEAFADKVGISPGVVAGRLQHDGLLPYSHRNGLKRRFQWSVG